MSVTEYRRCPGCTGHNGPCAKDRVASALDQMTGLAPQTLPEVQDGAVDTYTMTGYAPTDSTVVYCQQRAGSKFEAGKSVVRRPHQNKS